MAVMEVDYWKSTLSGAPALTEAPTDRQRPMTVSQEHCSHVKQQFLSSLQAGIEQDRSKDDIKCFIATVWQVWMCRYSRSEDVITGLATDEPGSAELQQLIGIDCNPVALRTSFADPAETFSALQTKVSEALTAALSHSSTAFLQIVDALKAPRTGKHAPVFQALLVCQDVTSQRVVPSIGQLDFVLEICRDGAGMQGILHYNTDLFDKPTAQRMLGHFLELCGSAVTDPYKPVAQLNLLTPPEVTQVLHTFNAWDLPYTELLDPERQTIHGMFEYWARRTPNAPSLTFGDTTLTFAELDALANQLAHHLIQLGAAPERPVGILMRRSLDLFTGLLAILKSGSAYVPMDPDYPADRLAIMAGDSKAPVVLSQSDLQDKVSEVLEAVKKDQQATGSIQAVPKVVLMDAERSAIAEHPQFSPQAAVHSTNMCYIIFTSGSTGRPKGTVLQHAGVVNYFLSLVDKLQLTSTDAFLQKAPISFDASVQELFNAFACGGRVVLAAPGMEKDTQALACLMAQQAVTNMSCVPSQVEVLLMESELEGCSSLRHVLVGGEALPPVLAARFGQRLPNAHLHNAYGPTETTVDATGYDVTAEFKGGASVPIGRPINNMRCYVLDKQLQLLPVGLAGELMVSGIQLAREYLHNPEKTAASFIPNPHNHDNHTHHQRMYRTGDLARWLLNGNIEFLGRLDDQVKLRGFRIELGEVEAVLMEAPGVKLAAAIVMKDASGTDRLVGFVSPAAVDSEAIIAELKQRLPAHFVPSLIVSLPEMPLSPAGKVDRKKLKSDKQYEPDWAAAAGAVADEEFAEPETELERQLQTVWQEVLAQDAISVTADFFRIGGTSLRVGMVMAKVRASIWSEASTALLFRAPTIRRLAQEIVSAKANEAEKTGTLSIPRAPFTDAQRAAGLEVWPVHAEFLQQDPADPAEAQETAAWHLSGAMDVHLLQQALAAVAQRHDLLRTRFWRKEGQLMQSIDGSVPRLEQKPFSSSNESIEGLLQAQAGESLNPEAGTSVLRAVLVGPDGGQSKWVLLLTLHRLAGNFHSLALLGDHLAETYAALKTGSELSLAKSGLQFLDVLHWQRQPLQLQKYEVQHLFWMRQLAYAPPEMFLPYDDAREEDGGRAPAKCVTFMLPGDLVCKLLSMASSCGATLFMTLMATWQLLLARYSRMEDVITLTTVANNLKRPDLDDVLGPFSNLVALRTDLSGAPTFRQLLGRVKAGILSALVHSELPFKVVLAALSQSADDVDDMPRFQSALNLEDSNSRGSLRGFRKAGLDVARLQVPKQRTLLDLDLFFYQVDNELQAELTYNAKVFEEETARRFADSLQVLLRGAADAPDEIALDLPLVPQADLEMMLTQFNDTLAPFPADKTINQLFEAHAAAQPDTPCLRDGDAVLTYAEVDKRANQLAYHLVASGVSPGATVMLLMHASPEAIVSSLAVLKAGCAYSTLSPKYDELATLILDASPALVITHRGLHGRLPRTATPLKVFNYDAEADVSALAKRPARQLPARASPGEAAVVEYVPGPNNRPLGIVHAHQGLINAMVAGLPPTWGGFKAPPPQMLLHSDLTGVGSLLETWVPLLHGGCIVIAPPDDEAVGELLAEAGVTAVLMEGPEISGLLEGGYLDSCESLRTVWLWNEQYVTPDLVESLAGALPEARLYQGFDAAECAFFVTLLSLSHVDAEGALHGQPLPNIKVYVLDERMKPVPLGVPGRLYVSGVCLARGYLHKPQLTAEAFIANPFFDPFADPPAFSRMFDTSVLSRWLPGGMLDFVGHADRQVMLRGAQVALGEVESVLEELPGVEQAVALVQEDPTGVQRLVAYVTPFSLSAAELMAGLRGKLPARMMPSTITPLAEFPRLMVSQRVDHVALPQPDWTAASLEYAGPSNGLETSLQKVFQEVLNKHRVSVTANFFAEGGTQKQAAEVMQKLHAIAGQELPSSMLARSPTVQGLAETLAAIPPVDPQRQYAISPAPFTASQRAAGVPCAAMQEGAARSYLTDREGETVSRENIPSAFRLRGPVNVTALQDALAYLIERHEVLRAKYVLQHGEVLQTNAEPGEVMMIVLLEDCQRACKLLQVLGTPQRLAVVEEQLQNSSTDHLMQRLQQEATHKFDLEHDPAMVHAVLFHLSTGDKAGLLEEHVLLLVVSHICSDGWSEKICMDEMAAAYNAFAGTGHPPAPGTLPQLPVSWVDYCFWQRGRTASGAALEAQRRYWRKTLAGAPNKPSLRTDFELSAGANSPGKYIRVTVSTDLTQGLESLALACGATLFTVAMAAWQLLLSQYGSSKDVVVLTAMAGRPTVELEPLVGWFACGCAVRCNLEGAELTLKQLLDRVRQAVQGAFANSELPSDQQVMAAGFAPREERRVMPTFFALHDAAFFTPPAMSGLEVSRIDLPPEATNRVFGDVMLEMELLHTGGQLSGTLAYNTGLFKESTAERVASQFQELLGAMVHAGPSAPVASLPVMSEMIRRLDAIDTVGSGSSRDEVEATGGLSVRKSLVPRKTFLGSLRTMQSTLPKVAEDSGFGERLFGVKSHIPGLEASASPGRPGVARPTAANGEQLLEIQSSTIMQALRMHNSFRPGGAGYQAATGMQPRHSVLAHGGSYAVRSSQGGTAQQSMLPRASMAQQPRASPAGVPHTLAGRSSLAVSHQRNIDTAARRAAGHSVQELSSMQSSRRLHSPAGFATQRRPSSAGARIDLAREDSDGAPAMDGATAASPFLSVVFPRSPKDL